MHYWVIKDKDHYVTEVVLVHPLGNAKGFGVEIGTERDLALGFDDLNHAVGICKALNVAWKYDAIIDSNDGPWRVVRVVQKKKALEPMGT